jgi:hypothetical protein
MFFNEECQVFISEPIKGEFYYIAERSPKGNCKLLWSVMPVKPIAADTRVEASSVPRWIRKQAYRMFYEDRKREEITSCKSVS